MSWHSFPHIPESGAHILLRYKGCDDRNLFEMTVREGDEMNHIEKWCYYDDYKESLKRKILNEKDL